MNGFTRPGTFAPTQKGSGLTTRFCRSGSLEGSIVETRLERMRPYRKPPLHY